MEENLRKALAASQQRKSDEEQAKAQAAAEAAERRDNPPAEAPAAFRGDQEFVDDLAKLAEAAGCPLPKEIDKHKLDELLEGLAKRQKRV